MGEVIYLPREQKLAGTVANLWLSRPSRLSLLRDALSGLIIASCALGFLALVIAGVG